MKYFQKYLPDVGFYTILCKTLLNVILFGSYFLSKTCFFHYFLINIKNVLSCVFSMNKKSFMFIIKIIKIYFSEYFFLNS